MTTPRRAERTFIVTDQDTAAAVGSGALPVLATPRLLAWCEAVTCEVADAVADRAPDLQGRTSVGVSVRLEHLAATAVGGRVLVRADLTDQDRNRASFAVVATDGAGTTVARGVVERVFVDPARFLARL